jgi:putative endonuclease
MDGWMTSKAAKHHARRQARQKAWRFGQLGETIACWMLRLKGYRILATRFKVPVGEVDIIAKRGDLLVFVEVKSRRARGPVEQPVSPKQQKRITRAARAYVQHNQALAGHDMRFDLILVRRWALPLHIMGAWRV